MSFKNRIDAGRKLAKALSDYKRQQPVILRIAARWRAGCGRDCCRLQCTA